MLPTLLQVAPLGEHFSYNNAGFVLLGRVLEVLTGRSYRAATAGLVLAPLDLARSTFDPAEVRRRSSAVGYLQGAAGTVPVEPQFLPRSIDPAGGLWSTPREQLCYARFHLGDGTAPGRRLLRPETLRLMQTPQVPIAGPSSLQMGLSWFVVEVAGRRLLYHGGDTFGQHTEFWIAPDAGLALVALFNAQPGGAIAGPRVFAAALREYLGVGQQSGGAPAPDATPPAPPEPTPEQLAQYAGRYRIPSATVTVRPQGGALSISTEPTLVPGHVGPDVSTMVPADLLDQRAQLLRPDLAVVTVEGRTIPLSFVRRSDGTVGWMSLSTRLIPRIEAT